MTEDDIIRMAREARVYEHDWHYKMRDEQDALEHFAALIAAAEREACAKLCEATPYLRTTLGGRSRAEVEGELLAEAIRARSQS
jgi:hypothetical protein